jgi:hypothetical protein
MQTHPEIQGRSFPEMSAISQIPRWLSDELQGTSLVNRMLEIIDHATPDNRTESWFKRLECLSVHPCKEKVLVRAIVDLVNLDPRDFIAVSYSFESADKSLEISTMGFEIHDSEDRLIKKAKTRDIVLQRVMRYAEAIGIEYFWIDRECIDQENAEERQEAMDSMDLVYGRSAYPVALLEITLRSYEVELLDDLMSRKSVHSSEMNSMVELLENIQGDRWWKRAWTFQEEYLASDEMKLLIRHESTPIVCISETLGDIEGEVQVCAIQFRDLATKFLQNRINRNTTSEKTRSTCKTLLRTFRRYNSLEDATDSANGMAAMSSKVFEDLECRDIYDPYDLLPIAANVCGYGVRFHSAELTRLTKGSHRTSLVRLCALTMYLLNGEIFFNGKGTRKLPTKQGLSEYIKYISFDHFFPPSNERRKLSWLKQCRLWPERLSEQGIVTSGYLWRVDTEIAEIETRDWNFSSPEMDDSEDFGLNADQRARLNELMGELEQRGIYKGLWHQLGRFLEQDGPQTYAKEYMNTMAGEVVEAIHCGRSLYVATLEERLETGEYDNQDDAFAIFVLYDDDVVAEHDFCVFTSSWESHHVSMIVDVEFTHSEPDVPLMTIAGWTNGLAFYNRVSPQETVYCWPEIWQQKIGVEQPKTPERKRSSEHPRALKSRRAR